MAIGRGVRRGFQKLKIVVVDSTGSSSSVQDPIVDQAPDQFTFTDVNDVATSTLITSDTITISGLGTSVTASISGDASSEFQRNGGTWGSTALSAQNGDTFAVRHTSSDSTLTNVSTTLTVGDVSDTFTSRTAAPIGSAAGQPTGLLLAITKAA